MSPNPLSQLQGIHLPQAISWWPLAPGWYVLIALLIILVLALIFVFYKRQKKRQRRLAILAHIDQLEQRYQQQEITAVQALAQLSVLIKRIAISFDRQNQPQALTGEAWLNYLDQGLGQPEFSQGVGRCLLDGPYQKQVEFDAQLFEMVQFWAKRVMSRKVKVTSHGVSA